MMEALTLYLGKIKQIGRISFNCLSLFVFIVDSTANSDIHNVKQ